MTQDHSLALSKIDLTPNLDLTIAHFGARRVLWAAVLALLRPQSSALAGLSELDDHLRRDMGLPPRTTSPPVVPPPSLRGFW